MAIDFLTDFDELEKKKLERSQLGKQFGQVFRDRGELKGVTETGETRTVTEAEQIRAGLSPTQTSGRAPIRRTQLLARKGDKASQEADKTRREEDRQRKIAQMSGLRGSAQLTRSQQLQAERLKELEQEGRLDEFSRGALEASFKPTGKTGQQKLTEQKFREASQQARREGKEFGFTSARDFGEAAQQLGRVPQTIADVRDIKFTSPADSMIKGDKEDPKDFQIRKVTQKNVELGDALNTAVKQNDIRKIADILQERQVTNKPPTKEVLDIEQQVANKKRDFDEIKQELKDHEAGIKARLGEQMNSDIQKEFNQKRLSIKGTPEAVKLIEKSLLASITAKHEEANRASLEELDTKVKDMDKSLITENKKALSKIESSKLKTIAERKAEEKLVWVNEQQEKDPELSTAYLSNKYDQQQKYDSKGEKERELGEKLDAIMEGPEDDVTKFEKIYQESGKNQNDTYKALESRFGKFVAQKMKKDWQVENNYDEASVATEAFSSDITDFYTGDNTDVYKMGELMKNMKASGLSDGFIRGQLNTIKNSLTASESIKEEARSQLAELPEPKGVGKFEIKTVGDKLVRVNPQTGEMEVLIGEGGLVGEGQTGEMKERSKRLALSAVRTGRVTKTRIEDLEKQAIREGWDQELVEAIGEGKVLKEGTAVKFGFSPGITTGVFNRIIAKNEEAGFGTQEFQKEGMKEAQSLAKFIKAERDIVDMQFLKMGTKKFREELRDQGVAPEKIDEMVAERWERYGSAFKEDEITNVEDHEPINTGKGVGAQQATAEFFGIDSSLKQALLKISGKYTVAFMKEASGVAISEPEARRLQALIPNIKQSDGSFIESTRSALIDVRNDLETAAGRYKFDGVEGMNFARINWANRIKTEEELARGLPEFGVEGFSEPVQSGVGIGSQRLVGVGDQVEPEELTPSREGFRAFRRKNKETANTWQEYEKFLASLAKPKGGDSRKNPKFVKKVDEVSNRLGIKSEDLITAMGIETVGTFDPAIKNPKSSASGLIQFMESTAKAMGTTTEKIRKMNAVDQLDLVEKYINNQKKIGKIETLGDIYLSIAAPAFLGKADNTVVYPKGSEAWNKNPGWRANGGAITVASIKAFAEKSRNKFT